MKKERYQEAEMTIIKIQQEDIVHTSNVSDNNKPIELPFIPVK